VNRKMIAGAAAALTLAGATAANAQVLITEPSYVVDQGPAYSEPVIVAPAYAGPDYVVTSSGYVPPRYSYTIPTRRSWAYDAAYYGEPASCSIDLFGNRICY
jgi:hypothetical protein